MFGLLNHEERTSASTVDGDEPDRGDETTYGGGDAVMRTWKPTKQKSSVGPRRAET